MNFVVVTTCTKRKRHRPADQLQARSLTRGPLDDVARQWLDVVRTTAGQVAAVDLYCGRGFQEAVRTSSSNGMPLFVVSAGLGMVAADQRIPAYSLTLTNGSPDSIRKKVVEQILPTDWWAALSNASGHQNSFADLVRKYPKRRIFVACSELYAGMIARDIRLLPSSDQARIRMFGPRDPSRLPTILRPFVMPYDERFDGSDGTNRGTRSDFPQRTLRHFVETFLVRSSIMDDPEGDAQMIKEALESWAWPNIPIRQKVSDEQILELIPSLWERARNGSVPMLRILRDEELIACEQRRFATLIKLAKE